MTNLIHRKTKAANTKPVDGMAIRDRTRVLRHLNAKHFPFSSMIHGSVRIAAALVISVSAVMLVAGCSSTQSNSARSSSTGASNSAITASDILERGSFNKTIPGKISNLRCMAWWSSQSMSYSQNALSTSSPKTTIPANTLTLEAGIDVIPPGDFYGYWDVVLCAVFFDDNGNYLYSKPFEVHATNQSSQASKPLYIEDWDKVRSTTKQNKGVYPENYKLYVARVAYDTGESWGMAVNDLSALYLEEGYKALDESNCPTTDEETVACYG